MKFFMYILGTQFIQEPNFPVKSVQRKVVCDIYQQTPILYYVVVGESGSIKNQFYFFTALFCSFSKENWQKAEKCIPRTQVGMLEAERG